MEEVEPRMEWEEGGKGEEEDGLRRGRYPFRCV